MSKIEVDAIDKQSGSTLTLGGSGTAVTLACGATQTGFGRTGTVDWQTGSIKTATFTAANGQGFFADTSSGAFTMNLPAGTAGNIVSVVDYTNTFQNNALTVTPNGSQKIGGVNASFIASTEGQSLTWVYVDDTEGWKNVQDSTSNAIGNAFISATGGTTADCGNCRIHTFTGPGTFTVSQAASCSADNIVSYVIVAGGGGGGAECAGGGGGAGGYREVKSPTTPFTASPLDGFATPANRVTVTATAFPIVVGGGGAAGSAPGPGGTGNNSSFGGIIAAGGGFGGGGSPKCGGDGGSGGGGGHNSGAGGTGNTPSVSPAQGKDGANSAPATGSAPSDAAGGGGGATTDAIQAPNPPGAFDHKGGTGATSSITGSAVTRAGGGGGSNRCGGGSNDTDGGDGGGGKGGFGPRPGPAPQSTGQNGTDNTGGGGGGGKSAPGQQNGGAGGSGIVIIRYKFQ